MSIKDNIAHILSQLPEGVQMVAAAKTVDPAIVLEAVEAGVTIIGENYLQEAESAYAGVGKKAEWHFIGHLQRNKVKKAVQLFDMIQTVDSAAIAAEIDARCAQAKNVMPVLIEVNSGREPQKAGVLPEDAESLVREISRLKNVRLQGLMTMGPLAGDPEESRPYFSATRRVFEDIGSLDIAGVEMKYLSMGMSNSYKVAIQEGANMVRIGSLLFGPRR